MTHERYLDLANGYALNLPGSRERAEFEGQLATGGEACATELRAIRDTTGLTDGAGCC